MLAERGFRVVRFDNRDIGHSTDAPRGRDAERGSTCSSAAAATRPVPARATWRADTFGLMDHLGIESAHVVGASMGGMIGQTMAIDHPERVRSLVSIMSTTGSRRVGYSQLPRLRPAARASRPTSREAYDRAGVKTFRVIGSPGYPFDEERIARAGRRARTTAATDTAGDRPPDARDHAPPATAPRRSNACDVPTHRASTAAKDLLVRPAAGRATAEAIPGARLRIFEGMGHDLPRALWPDFVDEIAAAAERGGATLRAAPAEAA